MKLIFRLLITMAALFVAAWLVPGIQIEGNGWVVFAVMALILAVLNVTIKPILKLLSCGLIIVTMGLFTFVINALMLMIASWVSINWFNVTFIVDNFWSALLGSLIVSVVSMILNIVFIDKK
jgi:putative membrane protein